MASFTAIGTILIEKATRDASESGFLLEKRLPKEKSTRVKGRKSKKERERERAGAVFESGDFETRVMAFLVLSCVRTLTLLAHIRA